MDREALEIAKSRFFSLAQATAGIFGYEFAAEASPVIRDIISDGVEALFQETQGLPEEQAYAEMEEALMNLTRAVIMVVKSEDRQAIVLSMQAIAKARLKGLRCRPWCRGA